MNRKRMRKRSISWLLVLSMVLSLFGGEFASPLSAKADGEATITFGDAKISSKLQWSFLWICSICEGRTWMGDRLMAEGL